jgi:cell division protein FtsA
MLEQKILTIDLGTSAIRVALSVIHSGNRKTITMTSAPSRGIRGGNIINFQSAKDSLNSALNKLKVESSVTIPPEAYVLITGAYTISYAVEAKITFAGIKTISYSDVNEVKDKAKRELFKKHRQAANHFEIIHIIPQEFIIENLTGIQNPIGHNGRELTMKAFVILASKSSIKTIESLLKEVGLKLKGVVLQSFAATHGIRDEKVYLNNNLVIYMGAGNTEYFYFREDKPVLLKHLPFGSEDIIDNLVHQLKVSRKEAKRLFLEHGSAYAFRVNKEEIIDISYGMRTKKVPKILIAALIHAQLKKLFKDIKEDLNSSDPTFVSNLNGVYLTGGLAKLKDIDFLASKILKAPVIVADTQDEVMKDTVLSPIVGTTNFVMSLKNNKRIVDIKEDLTKDYSKGSIFSGIWRFITDLI